MTLSLAILVSLAISLTTTPMMCAIFLKPEPKRAGPKRRTLFDRALALYERTLAWSLRHSLLVMLVLLVTIVLNVALYVIVPKGFFPNPGYRPDDGRDRQADQSISFQAMQKKLAQLMSIVQARSGGAARGRLYRPGQRRCRRPDQYRPGLRGVEAAVGALGHRRR